eukprot:6346912-Prymnesium_polylepis.3
MVPEDVPASCGLWLNDSPPTQSQHAEDSAPAHSRALVASLPQSLRAGRAGSPAAFYRYCHSHPWHQKW